MKFLVFLGLVACVAGFARPIYPTGALTRPAVPPPKVSHEVIQHDASPLVQIIVNVEEKDGRLPELPNVEVPQLPLPLPEWPIQLPEHPIAVLPPKPETPIGSLPSPPIAILPPIGTFPIAPEPEHPIVVLPPKPETPIGSLPSPPIAILPPIGTFPIAPQPEQPIGTFPIHPEPTPEHPIGIFPMPENPIVVYPSPIQPERPIVVLPPVGTFPTDDLHRPTVEEPQNDFLRPSNPMPIIY